MTRPDPVVGLGQAPSARQLAPDRAAISGALTSPDESSPPAMSRTELLVRQSLIAVAFVVSVPTAVFRSDLLPERFLYDSERLQLFIQFPGMVARDGSYKATAQAWSFVANGQSSEVVGFFTFLLYAALQMILVPPSRAARLPVVFVVAYSLSFLFGAVFASGYTKEFFVVMVLAAACMLNTRLTGWLLAVAAMVVYAAVFRQYWWVTVVVFVSILLVAGRSRWAWVKVAGGFIVAVLGVAGLYQAFLGETLGSIRANVLEDMAGVPDSVIQPPFASTSVLGQAANTVVVSIQLQIPYPLLSSGILQIAAGFMVLLYWVLFWRGAGRILPQPTGFFRERRVVAVVVAFLLSLAIFEPDFGSYVRHLTPAIPLLLYVSYAGIRLAAGVTGADRSPLPNTAMMRSE